MIIKDNIKTCNVDITSLNKSYITISPIAYGRSDVIQLIKSCKKIDVGNKIIPSIIEVIKPPRNFNKVKIMSQYRKTIRHDKKIIFFIITPSCS